MSVPHTMDPTDNRESEEVSEPRETEAQRLQHDRPGASSPPLRETRDDHTHTPQTAARDVAHVEPGWLRLHGAHMRGVGVAGGWLRLHGGHHLWGGWGNHLRLEVRN